MKIEYDEVNMLLYLIFLLLISFGIYYVYKKIKSDDDYVSKTFLGDISKSTVITTFKNSNNNVQIRCEKCRFKLFICQGNKLVGVRKDLIDNFSEDCDHSFKFIPI